MTALEVPCNPRRWAIITADCVKAMAGIAQSCFDAIVTDPPYGLEFMGKEWDRLTATPATGIGSWATGFTMTDYADGAKRLPRPTHGSSRNPMCQNCHRHRYGARGCRCEVPRFDEHPADGNRLMQEWHMRWSREALRVLKPGAPLLAFGGCRTFHRLVCALEDAGFEILGTLCWLFGSGFPKNHELGDGRGTALKPGHEPIVLARRPCQRPGVKPVCETAPGRHVSPDNVGSDGASRFLYCPKASRAERNAGLDGFPLKVVNWSSGERSPGTFQAAGTERLLQNHHPTVKPIDLMRWLCRSVMPRDGVILDPFAGSGTTGIAAILEGLGFIGIERAPEYGELATARIRWWEQYLPGTETRLILAAAADRPGVDQLRLDVA